MVHAYSDAAKAVLELAETKELVPMRNVNITLPYPLYNTILNKITPLGFETAGENFSDDITITGTLPEEQFFQLEKIIQETGNGKIILKSR